MSAASVSFRAPMLAWAIAVEDEARFKRILRCIVGVAALACLIFSLMPRPQEDRAKPVELPPRLAKLVLERENLPRRKRQPSRRRLPKRIFRRSRYRPRPIRAPPRSRSAPRRPQSPKPATR